MSTDISANALHLVAANHAAAAKGPLAWVRVLWDAMADGFAAHRAYQQMAQRDIESAAASRILLGHFGRRG